MHNRLTLFHGTEQFSSQIDTSFLEFDIPSATDLYREIISRDQYELVSQLSFSSIEQILWEKECNIEDFARAPDIKLLSNTHYHYIFHFKKMDDFAERHALIAVLNKLRHVEANKDTLFLETDAVKLHFYHDYGYGFDASGRISILPRTYRALCIYDLIVTELYMNNATRTDKNYTNSLISDYLSVHSKQFAKINGRHTTSFDVIQQLIGCLKNIPCDRQSAAALHWGFADARCAWPVSYNDNHINDKLDRGAMAVVPLTPAACFNKMPENKYDELNQYSHYYCSLIQYRYLMDLKSLFSFVSENTLQRIKDHMIKWEDFKTQPIITKYEALINKIENISWEKWRDFFKPSAHSRGILYWEEKVSKDGYRMVCVKAFNNTDDGRLLEKFFVEKMREELRSVLKIERRNSLSRCNPLYHVAYYLVVNQQDLAACSLKNLLTYSDAAMQILNNTVLEKLTLSNLQFFKTREPRRWIDYYDYRETKHCNEMREFIWVQAAWLMLRDWFLHYKDVGVPPTDLLFAIAGFLKGLLVLEYNRPQISTKRLQ
jgi:hypothetical protein